MRVVVTGASGNVGTSVLHALAAEPAVGSVVGLARRRPDLDLTKVEWREADVGTDDLRELFGGADAVIHLAWEIQPSRNLDQLWRTNVEGSVHVLDAVAHARTPALLYASSVGAYSPGPKDRPVAEDWPTHGVATLAYSREKAYVERLLDAFELANPATRVVRMRQALVFKPEAATEVRNYFLGRLVPERLVGRGLPPVLPRLPRLAVQAVHSLDVGEAYRLALTSQVRGAFNLAADPVLDAPTLAEVLGARLLPLPVGVVRAVAATTWRLGLQPSPAGWLDLALRVPVMDTTRARTELGWVPRFTAVEALRELLEGMQDKARGDTPPLEARLGGESGVDRA